MLTANGSCVIAIMKRSAGSSGRGRRHGEENGSPTLPFFREVSTFTVASAVVITFLLDRLRSDLLALAQRARVLRRPGDHAREQLCAAVPDVLELWDADVLHPRQPWTLRRARVLDRSGLHRGKRLRRKRRRSLLVLRDPVGREPCPRRDRGPAALRLRSGGLDVARARRPRDVLPCIRAVGGALGNGERPAPQPA